MQIHAGSTWVSIDQSENGFQDWGDVATYRRTVDWPLHSQPY